MANTAFNYYILKKKTLNNYENMADFCRNKTLQLRPEIQSTSSRASCSQRLPADAEFPPRHIGVIAASWWQIKLQVRFRRSAFSRSCCLVCQR